MSRPWQQVTVPVWGRLDRLCSWAELAEQSESDAVVEQVASFQPSAILGVDWSSLPVYKALSTALQAKGLHVPPYIYMNYRYLSFTHMTWICALIEACMILTASPSSEYRCPVYTPYCCLYNLT